MQRPWAIDFGLCAFSELPPGFAVPGAWVKGELLVGIDSFSYKERLHKLPGMPDLFYNWRVALIMRNDTPWLVEVNVRDGKTLSRNGAQETWTSVARTDAWNGDSGRLTYILTVDRRTSKN